MLKRGRLWYRGILILMFVFLIIVFVIYKMQQNVGYEHQERLIRLLEPEQFTNASQLDQQPRCLLLWDEDIESEAGRAIMEDVLAQMKVPYVCKNVNEENGQLLDDYESVVLCISDMKNIVDIVIALMDWMRAGGKLMFTFLPWNGNLFNGLMSGDLGIKGIGERQIVEELRFTGPLMPGGQTYEFHIEDPYRSSYQVLLDDDCQVYLESAQNSVPLIWRDSFGEGTAVVVNLGFMNKIYRGFYAAAYSLLGDAFAWPVINSSTFYLDDFPSPIPMGDSEFITRDYGMSIDDFMRRVWWEDVRSMTEKYGVRFTGMVIEDYSDQVEGEFLESSNFTRYQYFGNMLLSAGGEIGFHGYNHMPLVLENFDYHNDFNSYRQWKNEASMKASLEELNRFCESIFPKEMFQVYVPPSNILSDEAREMIASEFPQIRAIASTYLEGGLTYVQEFEVADDGIVETPRIISGCEMDDYTRLSALAELTMHYVNTHFMHPDDTLDVDRGAELGWAEMFSRLTEYADWLYTAAPGIRNLTGSELGAAVQRYDTLQVEQKVEDGALQIELGGFVDEAYLLVRLNGKTPGEVSGGELSKVMDTLYLLRADEANVRIALGA